MENEEDTETYNSKFKKQLGDDENALTRSDIMTARGYPVKKKGKNNGK